jgi:hypothetical protein
MQCDALTEVNGSVVERLPVPASLSVQSPNRYRPFHSQVQVKVMLQIYTSISSSSHTPKRTLQLLIMHPHLHILATKKLIQPSRMIKMQMPNDNLLDILNLIPSRRNRIPQFMSLLILYPRKHICHLWPPHFWVILAATCFPEDKAFVGVGDQTAVDGEVAAFVGEGLACCGAQGGVGAA